VAEKEYQDLWKKYFETIAIKERTNPRCQKNFMPVRYWKNLTELR
jgi:probable DNA metabolism protein